MCCSLATLLFLAWTACLPGHARIDTADTAHGINNATDAILGGTSRANAVHTHTLTQTTNDVYFGGNSITGDVLEGDNGANAVNDKNLSVYTVVGRGHTADVAAEERQPTDTTGINNDIDGPLRRNHGRCTTIVISSVTDGVGQRSKETSATAVMDGAVERSNNTEAAPGCQDPADGCTRRCCERGHRLNASLKCTPAAVDSFRPALYRLPDLALVRRDASRPLGQLRGHVCVHGKYRLRPEKDPDDVFYLLEDGRLFVRGYDEPFNTSWYCVEPLGDSKLAAYVCFPEQKPRQVALIYPVCMLLSLPCLAATFLAYALVPRLRNLHGKSLLCHVASLFLLYLSLAATDLSLFPVGTNVCVVVAFIIYFSFLASFFWLNVMCFDIWWTFSGFRPLRGSEKEREHKKFVIYSIYAWGSSMVLLLVCLLMDLLPGIPEHVVAPQIGRDRCWFFSREAEAAYFYGPMALIVLCNIILFVLTALRIVKLKKETAMLKGEESRRHDVEENKQRFVLYLKLFVVMGVNWGMEVISFIAGGPQYLWYITDIGNTLQGVLIFLIFVWKAKIRRLLVRRLCPRLARNATRNGSEMRGTMSKSVASPTSSFTLTTKGTSNGTAEMTRITREESDIV